MTSPPRRIKQEALLEVFDQRGTRLVGVAANFPEPL
jgi:hypothetical protein